MLRPLTSHRRELEGVSCPGPSPRPCRLEKGLYLVGPGRKGLFCVEALPWLCLGLCSLPEEPAPVTEPCQTPSASQGDTGLVQRLSCCWATRDPGLLLF